MAAAALTASEESQLAQTIEMFEVITVSQPNDYQSLEILKEAYAKLGREEDVIKISKRIAQAYVDMGQLSSAILEYESILQRYPGDPDVTAALSELEKKANSLSASASSADQGKTFQTTIQAARRPATPKYKVPLKPEDIDDGRNTMHKLFVDSKLVSASDFKDFWPKPDLSSDPHKAIEPFVQVLADKGILPLEKSLKIISDKCRMVYLPIEKYDVDHELARSFSPATCLRWCVLPFDLMGKSVLVATANPFNRQAEMELEQDAKQRLQWYLAPPLDIINALKKTFR